MVVMIGLLRDAPRFMGKYVLRRNQGQRCRRGCEIEA